MPPDAVQEEQAEAKVGAYKVTMVSFAQEDLPCRLNAQLFFHPAPIESFTQSHADWQFQIYNTEMKEHIYRGTLQETIELILLGKLVLSRCKEEAV